MLFAYAKSRSPEQIDCDKTFKELCCEWLASAKLRVKHSSYCCYEKLINEHIIPYYEDMSYGELGTPVISHHVEIRSTKFGYQQNWKFSAFFAWLKLTKFNFRI